MALAPFTYDDYSDFLDKLAGRGYSFAAFPEAAARLQQGRPFVLLRHDIDFDLEKALQMAEIEAGRGASATYFFLVRTSHYNLFSREGTATVSRILALGHRLGLHFDCAAYDPKAGIEELQRACLREAKLLEEWFEVPLEIVSYHRPSQVVLAGDPALSAPLLHTYLPLFTKEICYRSDSRGEWRYGHPRESGAFQRGEPLHALVHPIWWHDTPSGPQEILDRYALRRHEALVSSIASNCDAYQTTVAPAS